MSLSISKNRAPIRGQKSLSRKGVSDVFIPSVLTRNITVPITAVNENIKNTFLRIINNMMEGSCIVEGYVKVDSVKIISYSSGLVNGDNIVFSVVFECEIANFVSGMLLNCIVLSVVKSGLKLESSEYSPSPFVVFILRECFGDDAEYINANVSVGDAIRVKVEGQVFELDDEYITIFGELILNK